ncbi:MAG: thioredoxin domain-containing protein [Bacilli bacterium]
MKPKIKLFGATWCGTCSMVKPLLERLGEVEYIDVDEDVDTTAEYGVRALPTYINEETGDRGTGPVRNLQELREVLGIE